MRYISTHKLKSILVIFFCFVLFIAISKSQTEEVFFVPYSGDIDGFISELDQRGMVPNSFSKLVLKFILTIRGGVEPGGYALSKGMGAVSTALSLKDPEYAYVSVQEGYRKGQIAQVVGDKLNWESQKIQLLSEIVPVCPYLGEEGYLASGTYLIHKDEEVEVVEETMLNTFREVLSELGLEEKDISIPKIITIASLIQREAGGKSDMRLISGIIHNRLKIGMPLQIDATLQYVKGDENQWWPVPKSEDKNIDSPFNTYQNVGLPPTPIATPGKEAIRAALNPIKTKCLFYLHDERRNIHCATTYDQHKKNVRYYLK